LPQLEQRALRAVVAALVDDDDPQGGVVVGQQRLGREHDGSAAIPRRDDRRDGRERESAG
jgi:hypothetical protein